MLHPLPPTLHRVMSDVPGYPIKVCELENNPQFVLEVNRVTDLKVSLVQVRCRIYCEVHSLVKTLVALRDFKVSSCGVREEGESSAESRG